MKKQVLIIFCCIACAACIIPSIFLTPGDAILPLCTTCIACATAILLYYTRRSTYLSAKTPFWTKPLIIVGYLLIGILVAVTITRITDETMHVVSLVLTIIPLLILITPSILVAIIRLHPAFSVSDRLDRIKQIAEFHPIFLKEYASGSPRRIVQMILREDGAIQLPEIAQICLTELIALQTIHPLSLVHPEKRALWRTRIGGLSTVEEGITIEGARQHDLTTSLVITTRGKLVPEDLVSGKPRAKMYEALSSSGHLLKRLHYNKLERRIDITCFGQHDFPDARLLTIAQQIEYGCSDLQLQNANNEYPTFLSYEVIDCEGDKIYTVKFRYTLPVGLGATIITPEKLKQLNSYVRYPLYQHKLLPHQDVLDLYVELDARPFDSMKFSDFPMQTGLRVPLGFDLTLRKPVYLNFDQTTIQEGDYGFAPHYIVAGATASGKSIFIKFLLLQLMKHNTPDQLRFFLVDPKVVSFNIFKDVPHLYAPIVSEAKKFSVVLQGIIEEVEKRYRILAEAGVQNIQELKQKDTAAAQNMPHILVVIDEFADIIDSQQSRSIKESILQALKRLGQKARAAGVHIILITQRATSANIDGEIKANMPGRIAFRVANEGDSQLVLEDPSAADITRPGEGYAKIGDSHEIIHFQAPFISDQEIQQELAIYKDMPQAFLDTNLSAELMKQPLEREKITSNDLPAGVYPSIPIGINLESHKIISLHLARIDQKQDAEPTPHIIIAGATNSGKSRFAKLLVRQLALSGDPDTVQIALLDPKVVTFSVFKGLPHLIRPIITHHEDFLPFLKETLETITARYHLFAEHNVENIEAYRITTGQKLPSLIIIIDEFADLLDSYDYKGRDEIEKILKRFGQMARAAGIHMILITQRATSANIPGEIRTHFSGRIAFRMNTESDSHYILEAAGAESLTSSGVFLFKSTHNHIEKAYAPLFHNDELAQFVIAMQEKYDILPV